jgi:hypothetical protein
LLTFWLLWMTAGAVIGVSLGVTRTSLGGALLGLSAAAVLWMALAMLLWLVLGFLMSTRHQESQR